LAEVLGRNQGPTRLDYCEINYSVVANGLRGNSSLKFFKPLGNQEILVIADALKENKGLVDFDLRHNLTTTDETWNAVCYSLKRHPTLQILNLKIIWAHGDVTFPPESRIQALLDMLKVSTSIHTLYLDSRYSEHELFRRSVIPYLETNRLRPRVRAIQKARPIPYRAKVLGRALLSARTDANSLWMLLSGNPEVACCYRRYCCLYCW
jgi:hypothetical protein